MRLLKITLFLLSLLGIAISLYTLLIDSTRPNIYLISPIIGLILIIIIVIISKTRKKME
ncbi:hypothetical protein SAMN04489762_3010 [Terribacillus saccharophilus]|uniref:Exosortase n=1 Tax=Terribacillus saccharophilus TaxID=361277 RepID=A0AAX2EIM6_9BACI|nr:hypothetical protein SAMN04489762_3010 [Terribacillus saccharophilus]